MRALFYHTAQEWSGSARAFEVAAHGLVARGWDVALVCAPGSAVERRLAHGACEVFAPPLGGGWPMRSVRLRRLLRDRFVEVVFVHTDEEHLTAAAAQFLAGRGAVVRRVTAGERLVLGTRGRLALRLTTGGFLFTTREDLEAAGPIGARKLEPVVAELGVPLASYEPARPAPAPPAPGIRTIACVADRTSRVRVAVALRTMALLVPRHPELRLLLLGPGSDDTTYRMHAAALGITGSVIHLGVPPDPVDALRSADIGWVTAGHDDLAFGCLDLMAMRTPVLAERDSLARHYVSDGIAGLLLPDRDPSATAALVAGVLARDEQRQAMGNAGRGRVAREFTAEAMVDAFERAAIAARDRVHWRSR